MRTRMRLPRRAWHWVRTQPCQRYGTRAQRRNRLYRQRAVVARLLLNCEFVSRGHLEPLSSRPRVVYKQVCSVADVLALAPPYLSVPFALWMDSEEGRTDCAAQHSPSLTESCAPCAANEYPWASSAFCAACFRRRPRAELLRCGGCYPSLASRSDQHAHCALVSAYYCRSSGHSSIGCRAQHWPVHRAVCPRVDRCASCLPPFSTPRPVMGPMPEHVRACCSAIGGLYLNKFALLRPCP